jgi:hypothetical protein
MADFAKAALGPVASIASGIIGSNAAGKAAKAQEQASEAAIAEQRRQFDYITQTARPSQLVGNEALSALADRLGLRRPVENQFIGDLSVTPGISGTSQLANMQAGVPAQPTISPVVAQNQAQMTDAQSRLSQLAAELAGVSANAASWRGKGTNPFSAKAAALSRDLGTLRAQMGLASAEEGRLYDRNYVQGRVTLPGYQAQAGNQLSAMAPAPQPAQQAAMAPAPQQFQPIVVPPVAAASNAAPIVIPSVAQQSAPTVMPNQLASPSIAMAAQNEAETPIGYYQAQQLLAPFYQAGVQGLGQLTNLAMGQGVPEFLATNPAYQFRQQEAQKALERSAAARGGLLSGQFAKALQERSQGLASQEFENAYNRLAGITQAGLGTAESLGGITTERNKFVSNRADTRYGQLYNLANLGQSMTGQTQNAAQNMAMNVGNALTAAGQARAGGYVNKANAMTGTIGDLASFGGRMFAGF